MQLMKSLFFVSLVLVCISTTVAGQAGDKFPYTKREATLKSALIDFVAEIPGFFEDTAFVFFIQISASRTETSKVQVLEPRGLLKKRLRAFLQVQNATGTPTI